MGRIAKTLQRTPFSATEKLQRGQPTIIEDGVRLRAYELYLKRGGNPGDDVSDWLQAEREFMAN